MNLRGIDFGHVFCAAGARNFFGEGYWHSRFADWEGSTLVTKTTTIDPRAGNMPLKPGTTQPRHHACTRRAADPAGDPGRLRSGNAVLGRANHQLEDRGMSKERIGRAIISVYDKQGIVPLGRLLDELNVEIVSTGGTAKALREAGVPVVDVSEYTGFPELLGGRVKTLHPKVHAGILVPHTGAGVPEILAYGIGVIELVVVNLYPFEATVAKEGVAVDEAMEQMDIGGVTMIRAAAKNHQYKTVVVDPGDYPALMEELSQTHRNALGNAVRGCISLETRQRLATIAIRHTARYEAAVKGYFERAVWPGRG